MSVCVSEGVSLIPASTPTVVLASPVYIYFTGSALSINPFTTHECSCTERWDTSADKAQQVSCMNRYLQDRRQDRQ